MKLSLPAAYACAAAVFAVNLVIDLQRYVANDAVSTAVGRTAGSYLVAWLIWRVVRFTMKERAPDANLAVFVVAALAAVASLWQSAA